MLVVALVGTVTLFAVSFLLSYAGLAEAAGWARVPAGLSWAVPVTIDGSILVYTIAAWVFRARGESARLAWAALTMFAVLSVVANAVHAWGDSPAALRTGLGMVIAGLAPVAVVLTTHTIGRLIIAPPDAVVADAALEPEPPRADVVEIPAVVLVEVPDAEPEDRDARIVALRAENLSYAAIAETVGVSKTTVSRVLERTAAAASEVVAA